MVYRPKIDQKLCFVLMPFGPPFDSYYQQIIKPAAKDAGLDTIRSDEIYSTKPIIQDIWSSIWQARVVIAEVTGKNPNVNYELGLCHALGLPTIIITKDIADVPFDYRHRRCITYCTENVGWDDKLRNDLTATVKILANDTGNADELDWPYDTNAFKEPSAGSVLIAWGDSRKIVIRGASVVRNAIARAFGPEVKAWRSLRHLERPTSRDGESKSRKVSNRLTLLRRKGLRQYAASHPMFTT
jgi:hypothetical protein